jgi:hypothetical protein
LRKERTESDETDFPLTLTYQFTYKYDHRKRQII